MSNQYEVEVENVDEEVNRPEQGQKNLKLLTNQIFNAIDNDGDDEINEDELMVAITQIANVLSIEVPSKEEVLNILIEFDENNDGVLQYHEFEQLIHELFTEQSKQNEKAKAKKNQNNLGNFFASIQERKLTLESEQFLKLFEISKRQSRLSCQLSENMQIFNDQLSSVTCPKGLTVKQWQEKQQHDIRKRQKSFNTYIKTKDTDQKYIKKDVFIKNDGQVKSVYSCISPSLKPTPQELSPMNLLDPTLKKQTEIFPLSPCSRSPQNQKSVLKQQQNLQHQQQQQSPQAQLQFETKTQMRKRLYRENNHTVADPQQLARLLNLEKSPCSRGGFKSPNMKSPNLKSPTRSPNKSPTKKNNISKKQQELDFTEAQLLAQIDSYKSNTNGATTYKKTKTIINKQ